MRFVIISQKWDFVSHFLDLYYLRMSTLTLCLHLRVRFFDLPLELSFIAALNLWEVVYLISLSLGLLGRRCEGAIFVLFLVLLCIITFTRYKWVGALRVLHHRIFFHQWIEVTSIEKWASFEGHIRNHIFRVSVPLGNFLTVSIDSPKIFLSLMIQNFFALRDF